MKYRKTVCQEGGWKNWQPLLENDNDVRQVQVETFLNEYYTMNLTFRLSFSGISSSRLSDMAELWMVEKLPLSPKDTLSVYVAYGRVQRHCLAWYQLVSLMNCLIFHSSYYNQWRGRLSFTMLHTLFLSASLVYIVPSIDNPQSPPPSAWLTDCLCD